MESQSSLAIAPIVFYVLMSLWLLSEIYYAFKLRSVKTDEKGKDKSSFGLLWLVISLSIFFSISVSSMIKAPIISKEWFSELGLVFIFLGIVGRYFIIRQLGKFFTVDVTIRQGHLLKQDGFYRWIRHPSYAFSLLSFAGLGICLDNWVSLALAFIPPFIAFSYRIRIEEKALIEQFGKAYLDYKNHTKKLIPFLY